MKSLDDVLHVLSKERRRYALYALDQADGPVHITELAEQVSEWESGSREVSEEEFEDVVLSLRHYHLPEAAKAEYVHYDHQENEVEITGTSPEFRIVLTVGEALEQPAEGGVPDIDELTAEEFFNRMASG